MRLLSSAVPCASAALRRAAASSLLLLLLVAGPRAAGAEEGGDVPLPVDASRVLRGEATPYVVDGRVVIRAGVEVALQKGVRLQGKNDGVLVVEGEFTAHGITDTEIRVADLRIVAAEEVRQLHVDHCIFGQGSGVITEKDKPAAGMITIENCEFEGDPGIDVAMTSGKVKVMSVKLSGPLRLRGVDPEGGDNRVHGSVRTSHLRGEVDVKNVADITLRSNVFGGHPIRFHDVTRLDFDANEIRTVEIAFTQSEAGDFRKTKISKCDFHSTVIRFHAPVGKKKRESILIKRCWFGGVTDPEKLGEIIRDQDDDEANAVRVRIQNPKKRRLGLAADWK